MGLTVTSVIPKLPPPDARTTNQLPPNIGQRTKPNRNDPWEAQIAQELRGRINEWQTADGEWLRNARFELDFLDNHFLAEENGHDKGREMEEIGRSAFCIDMLGPSIDLMVNQARVAKISANFIPIAEGADQATADIRQGLYRNIERVSKAAIARETAYQLAVSVGRGYERVIIEDEPGPTFQKRIGIQRVDNIESIALDPTCLDFNYADAAWGYAFEDIWKQDAEQRHGEDLSEHGGLDLMGIALTDSEREIWFPKDKIRIGEYWRKVWKRREVWRLSDGREMWQSEVPAGAVLADDGQPNVKMKMDYYFEWRLMSGTQTIERRIWPGKYIPIIVFIGREVFRGRRSKIHRGMIRPAIAPSRIYDVMFSRMVDEVGLSPLPHLFAPEGSLSPEQEKKVSEINRHTWAVITYTLKKDDQGQYAPAPQWRNATADIGAIVQACKMAQDNLDRVLNTYAPNRGQAIADQSGKAIREIKDSGDLAHANLPDNYNRSIIHEATVVNDLMDFVYTNRQAITITHPDEKTARVIINGEYQDEKSGKIKQHLFGAGKYGVTITAGQSYPNQQRQTAAMLMDLTKNFAGPMQKVLYLLGDDLGIPNWAKYKQVLAPPGVKEGDDGPSPQQLALQIQQMDETAQQAHAIIVKLIARVNELGDKNITERMKIASNERIAAARDRTDIVVGDMKATHEANLELLIAQLEAALSELEHGQSMEQQAAAAAEAQQGQDDESEPQGAAPAAATVPPAGSPPASPDAGFPIAPPPAAQGAPA